MQHPRNSSILPMNQQFQLCPFSPGHRRGGREREDFPSKGSLGLFLK
jgi:hypothetical protein